MEERTIRRALVSVYDKDGIEPIVQKLHQLGVELVSTGGTYDFITSMGIPCLSVESVTAYPHLLHGRVKTLHPAIFGGILAQRDQSDDRQELLQHQIAPIDLVIVDLYPFSQTVASGASEAAIIEKIDIGGVSLIRAAAKNFHDVLVIPSKEYYPQLLNILESRGASSTLSERRHFAHFAFGVSSSYDSAIFNYFDDDSLSALRLTADNPKVLRYGENPHQKGFFFGDFEQYFDKLQGKELSYNNLQDIAAACEIIADFDEQPTFAILKHTNPCGLASRETLHEAWKAAYGADTESAFGGILVANRAIDQETAKAIGDLFFEVLIAPDFDTESLPILAQRSKRILLLQKRQPEDSFYIRSALGGYLVQEKDCFIEDCARCEVVSLKNPSEQELADCLFAQKVAMHCKSNAIVLVKNQQVLATGVGQTSRVASLRQAVEKAKRMGFSLEGATMGSDAFFPFGDCVELAAKEGITAIIQPGGSIRDKESIAMADQCGVSLVFTGVRHFKH